MLAVVLNLQENQEWTDGALRRFLTIETPVWVDNQQEQEYESKRYDLLQNPYQN